MGPSPAVEAKIHEEAAKLGDFYDRITSCHVTVEITRRYPTGGTGFQVRVDLTVPGGEILVSREPAYRGDLRRGGIEGGAKGHELPGPNKDAYAALRDAFKDARRQIQEFAQRRRGAVKRHAAGEEGGAIND
jgi:ribosome-associated translation inhibitor RaiA